MAAPLEIGDRVAYSSLFLRSLAVSPGDPKWGDRGRVIGFECGGVLAVVAWPHRKESMVNVANLRATDKGAGLNEEVPAAVGNAWVGMGFQKVPKL